MCTRAVLILILITFMNLFEFSFTFVSDELRVTLSNGNKLIGRFMQSSGGRAIKSFTGIPYAKPPIGPLRFKVSSSVAFHNHSENFSSKSVLGKQLFLCHSIERDSVLDIFVK